MRKQSKLATAAVVGTLAIGAATAVALPEESCAYGDRWPTVTVAGDKHRVVPTYCGGELSRVDLTVQTDEDMRGNGRDMPDGNILHLVADSAGNVVAAYQCDPDAPARRESMPWSTCPRHELFYLPDQFFDLSEEERVRASLQEEFDERIAYFDRSEY